MLYFKISSSFVLYDLGNSALVKFLIRMLIIIVYSLMLKVICIYILFKMNSVILNIKKEIVIVFNYAKMWRKNVGLVR